MRYPDSAGCTKIEQEPIILYDESQSIMESTHAEHGMNPDPYRGGYSVFGQIQRSRVPDAPSEKTRLLVFPTPKSQAS